MTGDLKAAAAGTVVAKMSDGRQVYKYGGEVKGPKIRFSPDPEETRQFMGSKTLFRVLVNERGIIEMFAIEQPSNAGLDREALAILPAWRFEPAKKNGVPVPMLIKIEMSSSRAY
jgi:TonB family protein